MLEIINPKVVYIAYGVTKNYHDGEDVAQEATMRMIRNIHKLQEPEAFEMWMYRITVNTTFTMKKKDNISLDLVRL